MFCNLFRWVNITLIVCFHPILFSQNWTTFGLDSLEITSESLKLSTGSQYGVILTDTLIENHPVGMEIEGIIKFPDSRHSQAFLIFGTDSNNVKTLWAVGYSRLKKQIIVGTVNLNESDSLKQISLDVQRKKNVEIVPIDKTIGMKANFYFTSNILKMRVHGVPLEIEKPFSAKSVNLIGYMVYGDTFSLRKPIIRVW